MKPGPIRYYPGKPPPRAPTHEDLKQTRILKACSKAVVESLRPVFKENPHKLLANLQPNEIEAVAVGVISAYIDERIAAEELNDKIEDLFAI